MQIGQIYNKVAQTYNQDLSGEILHQSKMTAIDMVIKQRDQLGAMLALGVGDGTDLLPYKKYYPKIAMHGLDISINMLKKTNLILDCQTYHGNITQASDLIDKKNFDLILAHFVTAYVPLPAILTECKKLLAKQGMISIITNTMTSFPATQAILPKLEHSTNPFNKLVAHHVNKALKTVYVPKNLLHLQSIVEKNGFIVKDMKEEVIPIRLNSRKDIYDFFIKGGWFVSGLIHPLLPPMLLRRISNQLTRKYFQLHYEDTMKISMVTAELA